MKFSFQSLKVFVGGFRVFLVLDDVSGIKNNEAPALGNFVALEFNLLQKSI